nr:unnamed protein product [Digitaria exilis]
MRTSSCLHLGISSSNARGSNTFPDSTEHTPAPKYEGGARARRRTDFGTLLEDADGEVGVGGAAELLEPDRRGEPRGPGAHDHHVVAERLPAAAEPPNRAPGRRAGAARGRPPRRRQPSPGGGRRCADGSEKAGKTRK